MKFILLVLVALFAFANATESDKNEDNFDLAEMKQRLFATLNQSIAIAYCIL